MMSDIFESEVVIPESYESSCLGACILGLYATGKIDSFEAVSDMVGDTYKHTPKEEAAKNIDSHADLYQIIKSAGR